MSERIALLVRMIDMRPRVDAGAGTIWGQRLAAALGFLVVATQRFGFGQDGAIQLTTVLSATAVLLLISTRRYGVSQTGALLFGLLVGVGLISLIFSADPSVNSLLLLFATYIAVMIGRSSVHNLGQDFMAGAMASCVLGAFLGIIQYVVQYLGGGFVDPVRDIPPELVRSGFNSYYAVSYLSSDYKPNGIIFLEPSFLSLYSAIGLVYMLVWVFSRDLTPRWWHIASVGVLVCGFAVSASTSGLVVLAFGAIPLIIRAFSRIAVLGLLTVVLLISWSVGVFDAIAAKAADTGAGSSTALRLFLPYQLLTPYWEHSPIIGLGPGATTKIIDGIGIGGLQATTTMKTLVEYGMLGALVILAIVVLCFVRSQAPLALIAAVGAAWLIPAEALMNSTLAMLILVGVGQWRAPVRNEVTSGLDRSPLSHNSSFFNVPSGQRPWDTTRN